MSTQRFEAQQGGDGKGADREYVDLRDGEVLADAKTYADTGLATKVDKVEGKGLSANDFTDELKEKLDDVESGAQENVIEVVKKNGTALTITGKAVDVTVPTKTSDITNDSDFQNGTQLNAAIAAVEAEIPDVIDNLTSTSSDDALSAKQGKELSDMIINIGSRGRFLSNWNCTTGLPATSPSSSLPYTYASGDYYIISDIAGTGSANYRPSGSTYTGAASTTVETSAVTHNDTYMYDGTNWLLTHTEIPHIAVDTELSSTSRNPVENRVVKAAIDGKQATLTAGTNINITNNTISATDTTYSDFTGATASTAGAHGLVPAPTTGDVLKYLKGDGSWGTPEGIGGVIELDVTDVQQFYMWDLAPGVYRMVGKWFYANQQLAEIAYNYDEDNDIYDWTYLVRPSDLLVVGHRNLTGSNEEWFGMIISFDGTDQKLIYVHGAGTTGSITEWNLGDLEDKAEITVTSTDPGEGTPLAANNFIAVYEA